MLIEKVHYCQKKGVMVRVMGLEMMDSNNLKLGFKLVKWTVA
jgi:hypothetical protein